MKFLCYWLYDVCFWSVDEGKSLLVKYVGAFAVKIRKIITKIYDPVLLMAISPGLNVYLNFSHNLPIYRRAFPAYDTALPRLAKLVKNKFGRLSVIDIGANVGDTAAFMSAEVNGDYLCIEGDEKYFKMLEKNIELLQKSNGSKISAQKALLGETSNETGVVFNRKNGTGNILNELTSLADEEVVSGKIAISSLDDILQTKQPAFLNANLLKIDTDGYDYQIMRGASQFLSTAKPLIFFELSPLHLMPAKEDLVSIFHYLAGLGYKGLLFYNGMGYPLLEMTIDKIEQITKFVQFAKHNRTYFDVLAVHESQMELFAEVCKAEYDHYNYFK